MFGSRNRPQCLSVLVLVLAAACSQKHSGADTTASAGAIAPESSAAAVAVTTTPTGQLALTVATKPGEGVYLTDANGRAVYFLETPDGTAVAKCEGECATAFDPVTGKAIVATGDTTVKVALIGDVMRPDGTKQVTYNGKPLYYYRKDQGANDTNGQGVKAGDAQAHLVTPTGKDVGAKK